MSNFLSIFLLSPDVDECQLDTDGCSQICTNTIGSFMCSCNDGYILADDDLGCLGKVLRM